MPVRIEELVFKTIIKADPQSNQPTEFYKRSTGQPSYKQLRKSILQELKNIANDDETANQER